MLSEMYKNFVRREIKEISRHQFLQTQSFMAGAIVPKWKGEFIKKKKKRMKWYDLVLDLKSSHRQKRHIYTIIPWIFSTISGVWN